MKIVYYQPITTEKPNFVKPQCRHTKCSNVHVLVCLDSRVNHLEITGYAPILHLLFRDGYSCNQ